MKKQSAGLLLYRKIHAVPEVFLVHPGGPFWAKKDLASWSIPKGLFDEGEAPLSAARREFSEETGLDLDGEFWELGKFRQPSGKDVFAWAIEGDFDPHKLKSNLFSMEWPPKSGKMQEFPEVDQAGWFYPNEAGKKLLKGQVPILEKLMARLGVPVTASGPQVAQRAKEQARQGSLFE